MTLSVSGASQTSHRVSNLVAFEIEMQSMEMSAHHLFEVCTYMFYNSCGAKQQRSARCSAWWIEISFAQWGTEHRLNTCSEPFLGNSMTLEIDKLQLHFWQWFVIIIWVRVRQITASYSTVLMLVHLTQSSWIKLALWQARQKIPLQIFSTRC